MLEFEREDDRPSAEVPAMYFRFQRTSDPTHIKPVLRHNAWDVLSLVALAAHLAAVCDGHEQPLQAARAAEYAGERRGRWRTTSGRWPVSWAGPAVGRDRAGGAPLPEARALRGECALVGDAHRRATATAAGAIRGTGEAGGTQAQRPRAGAGGGEPRTRARATGARTAGAAGLETGVDSLEAALAQARGEPGPRSADIFSKG